LNHNAEPKWPNLGRGWERNRGGGNANWVFVTEGDAEREAVFVTEERELFL
jgi:hypothetical protein